MARVAMRDDGWLCEHEELADVCRLCEAEQRIEQLERTLRDCLESLEWYAHAKGHHPENATPTSIIGQARALLAKNAPPQHQHEWIGNER